MSARHFRKPASNLSSDSPCLAFFSSQANFEAVPLRSSFYSRQPSPALGGSHSYSNHRLPTPPSYSRLQQTNKMSAFRNSDSDLAYGDLPPQRWDREKFDRYSRGGGGYDERDYRIQERERLGGGRGRRYLDIEVKDRIGPPRRFEERERFVEEDRYTPTTRRRAEFWQEPTQSEVAKTALTPYRRKSIVEQEIDIPIRRPPPPRLIRRQSSLDTFDRRPRYEDQYHIPPDVPIPLPIRRPRSPPRERDRYQEREFEEIRYRDLEPQSFDEYEDIRIRRERSRGPQRSKSVSKSVRSASSTSSSSFEEVETIEKKKVKVEIGKRGKTRMPKRLAHKQAIIDLGIPFEEEVSKSMV